MASVGSVIFEQRLPWLAAPSAGYRDRIPTPEDPWATEPHATSSSST